MEGVGMNKKLLCAMVVGLCVAGAAVAAEATTNATTLDNLQTAFNGESNAHARYTAFAVKADEEGYKSVAALFRAAALSESIHAAKHAAAIKKLGAEPKADIVKVEPKTTKENLEAALAGETYEQTTMYPQFIEKAKADKNKQAVRSFSGAMAAEVEHAKLYKQALAELDAWKAAGRTFMVCQVCGYTAATSPTLLKCPVCSAPREKFTIVQ
jgi:rubrerythrin